MTITAAPVAYSSANGDLFYNVFDAKANDPGTYTDYKYVADIYVNGALVASQKVAPHPVTKKGVFNIGPIIRNYVGFENLTFTAFPIDAMILENGTWFAKVTVRFGEEYGDTLYTNIVTDSERRFYNTYNGRLVGSETILPAYLHKFGTTRPLTQHNKARKETAHLFLPYLTRVEDWTHYQFLSDAGVNYEGQFYSGGIDWLINLDISPAVFNSFSPGAISSNSKYYTFTVDFGPSIKINIVDERVNEPHVIHFLNRFGGIESFEFLKKSVAKLDIEAKGIGLNRVSSDGSSFAGKVVNNNFKQYATRYTEKLTLTSGNLKEDTYKWLAEMVLSPMKWIEQDGFFVPVTFTGTNYEFKKRVNNNASSNQLTVEVAYNDNLNTQYL